MSLGSDSAAPAPPARRRADFWTGIVLVLLALAMIGGALQFPLQGTYAGVRNAWYVSPALFPLIVATCLLVLALVLLTTAIRAGAARAALAWSADGREAPAGGRDVLLIAGLIATFVVVFVPRIDFIAGAGLFLLAFTITFHTSRADLARLGLCAFFLTSAAVALVAVLGLMPAPRSSAAFLLDGAVLAVLAVTVLLAWLRAGADARPVGHCLGVSLLTPLILGVVFKFGLLVPLPREGVVVVALDSARYTLRAAF